MGGRLPYNGTALLGKLQIGRSTVSLFVVLLGLGLGVVSGPAIDHLAGRYWRGVYASLLAALSLVNVAFAGWAGSGVDIGLAVAGVALFSFIAGLGVGQSPWWLPAGLALHAAWNIAYAYGLGHAGLPPGYPILCASYTLALAAMLCRRMPRRRA